jgi:hypothetical protein
MVRNVVVRTGSAGSVEFEVGHKWEAPSGYALCFTQDGNLEVWNPIDRVVWESGTAGRGANKLALQPDGNLVIYADAGMPIWSTNTAGNREAYLAVESDGNIVLYAADRRPIWQTGTSHK